MKYPQITQIPQISALGWMAVGYLKKSSQRQGGLVRAIERCLRKRSCPLLFQQIDLPLVRVFTVLARFNPAPKSA